MIRKLSVCVSKVAKRALESRLGSLAPELKCQLMWAGLRKSPTYRWVGYVSYTTRLSLVTPRVRCQVSVTVIREMGCSVRGTDLATGSLTCWVFSWQRCPREAWCVCTAPKAGAASSSSSLLWILSKPQDCSKALGCLGYSLVDRPWAAQQRHDLHLAVAITATHHLAEPFPVVFLILAVFSPLWLWFRCSSGLLWFPCLGEITVLSIFIVQESRAWEPFSSLTPAHFCWAHSLPLDDINWIAYLIAVCEDWQGVVSCRLVSLKPWSRILHQHPALCLGAVIEHKLLFKELAHFASCVWVLEF